MRGVNANNAFAKMIIKWRIVIYFLPDKIHKVKYVNEQFIFLMRYKLFF